VSGKLWEIKKARFFFGVWRSTTFCGFQSGALGEGRSQSLCSHCVGKVMGNKKKLASFLEFGEVQLFVVFKAELIGMALSIPYRSS
jgi:hypothetical protein